jgi:nucleotide-binding universal stress UspA family protein
MTLQRIMLPTDGSPLSERAIFLAARIAQAQDAHLVAVRVVEPLSWIGDDVSEYLSRDRFDSLLPPRGRGRA